MRVSFIFVILISFNSYLANAEASRASNGLSDVGRKRIQQNLMVLEQNLQDTQSNLSITQRNIETLEAELKELEKLEFEHQELRKRFSAYQANATQELEKNEKAITDLEKYEKNLGSAPKDATGQKQLETAHQERMQRQRWKSEAATKMQRVQTLLKSSQDNLRSIDARKGPLKNQIRVLQNRHKEYEKLLLEIQTRKSDAEKLARQ